MAKEIQQTIVNIIVKTFVLTAVISTAGLFIFFNDETTVSEGKQGVTLFSVINIGLTLAQSLLCLIALFMSNKYISSDRLLSSIVYFLPLIPSVTISGFLAENATDKLLFVPLFCFIPFALTWTVFYFSKIKHAISGNS